MADRTIPDLSELEQWLRSGLTPQECADRYHARGDRVTAGAIRVARHRHNWGRSTMDHTALIPWKIQPAHRRSYEHRMLELESQRRQGKKLSPKWEQQLDRWLRYLDEDGAVIDYTPEAGWVRVHRRPGVDVDIISMPNLDDEREVSHLRENAPQVLRRTYFSGANS